MLGWAAAAYVAVGIVLGLLTLALIDRSDGHWPLVVLGFTFFMPLFFAVPAGALITWLRLKSELGAG